MIARLLVLLPFNLSVPEGEVFTCPRIMADEYEVRFHPPRKSNRSQGLDSPTTITIDDKPAFLADVLHIDFVKYEFDRKADANLDPPLELINEIVSNFIEKLRFVTQAPEVRSIQLDRCSWHIEYLNDDESELEAAQGFVRGRGARQFGWSFVIADDKTWRDIGELAFDYQPPEWNGLLLDAREALPHIGSAVVLAATALEVFIANVLRQLADRSEIPSSLWDWITNRNDFSKEPTVVEQFDILLYALSGDSLKNNQELWTRFRELRNARNTFVHTGVARSSKRRNTNPISIDQARQLVNAAGEIIDYVRTMLPDDLHWPQYERKRKLTMSQTFRGSSDSDE